MLVKTLQVVWHDKLPVLSCTFHQSGALVTCGADHDVKVWDIQREHDELSIHFRGTLKNHTKAVNCVRCKGDALVTAGDGGEMMVWGPGEADAAIESWKMTQLLRGHADDVTGVAWSPDGTGIMSASIENTVILWDVAKGKRKKTFSGHRHYVQGVAWDPLGELVLTQSTDRTMRVLRAPKARSKADRSDMAAAATFTQSQVVYKHVVPNVAVKAAGSKENAASGNPAAGPAKEQTGEQSANSAPQGAANKGSGDGKPAGEQGTAGYIFQDESLNTFFRRLEFSPEGSFVVAPAASLGPLAPSSACASAVAVFSRNKLAQPVALLPTLASATTCVSFCPVFFQSAQHSAFVPSAPAADFAAQPATPEANSAAAPTQGDNVSPDAKAAATHFLKLGYKLVFAVGSTDSIFVYDTESPEPLLVLGAIHFKHITDLAWSPDGRYLVASSHDGYCTIAAFAEDELGTPLTNTQATAEALRASIAEHRNAKASAAKKRASSKGRPSAGEKIQASSAQGTPIPVPVSASPARTPHTCAARGGAPTTATGPAPTSAAHEPHSEAMAVDDMQGLPASASESPLQTLRKPTERSLDAHTAAGHLPSSAVTAQAPDDQTAQRAAMQNAHCPETCTVQDVRGIAVAPEVPSQSLNADGADVVMADAAAPEPGVHDDPAAEAPDHAHQQSVADAAAAVNGECGTDTCMQAPEHEGSGSLQAVQADALAASGVHRPA